MIKNVKIWIGKDNEDYSEKVQKYLFSQGNSWYEKDYTFQFTEKSSLFINGDGNLSFANYNKARFDEDEFTEMKLVETVSYSLEEVKVRDKVCIGQNTYYKDELEVALKNVKPI